MAIELAPSEWGALLLILIACAFYGHYLHERHKVRRFALAGTQDLSNHQTIAAILRLAAHVHFHVPRQPDDPVFLCRFLAPLGATPVWVMSIGGCCSGLSRLLILSLDSVGVRAAQVTLSHRCAPYRHCLVEARLESGRAVLVDPKYGLYYADQLGRLIGLEDLRAGVEPRFLPLPGRKRAAYPLNEIYDWDFRNTVTANWIKSRPRRIAYRLLHSVSGGRIDVYRQPVWLEWPQLVICGCLTIPAILLVLA